MKLALAILHYILSNFGLLVIIIMFYCLVKYTISETRTTKVIANGYLNIYYFLTFTFHFYETNCITVNISVQMYSIAHCSVFSDHKAED